MDIRIESLIEGAQSAYGAVVIIDVFRAFTTAAVAFEHGARKIIMVAQPEEALALRQQGKGDLCVGEVGGIPPPGFDFGNSPFELARGRIEGKTLIQSTRAGTVGITTVQGKGKVYAASLCNARATAQMLLKEKPETVTIVAMGLQGKMRTDEDEICALYLRNIMEGRQPDTDAIERLIRTGNQVEKFMDDAEPYLHPEDVDYALQIDRIPIAIHIKQEDDLSVAYPLFL